MGLARPCVNPTYGGRYGVGICGGCGSRQVCTYLAGSAESTNSKTGQNRLLRTSLATHCQDLQALRHEPASTVMWQRRTMMDT